MTACRHCARDIVRDAEGLWVDPEATGDDSMWRETCGGLETWPAEHEPDPDTDLPPGYRWATEDELEAPGAIVVPRSADSNGVTYTQEEADIAVPVTMHLLTTREGNACGVDGPGDADINAVDCPACLAAHDGDGADDGPVCEECGKRVPDYRRDLHGDIVCEECEDAHPEWYADVSDHA